MGYYFAGLLWASLIFLIVSAVCAGLTIQLFRQTLSTKGKSFWLLMLCILIYWGYSVLFVGFKDIPHALQQNYSIHEGVMTASYYPNQFEMDGRVYTKNPWTFSLEEGKVYRIYYLPSSGYVVDIEKDD